MVSELSTSVILEASNGLIVVIGGLILYAIERVFAWARKVDKRLERIERAQQRGNSPGKPTGQTGAKQGQ